MLNHAKLINTVDSQLAISENQIRIIGETGVDGIPHSYFTYIPHSLYYA